MSSSLSGQLSFDKMRNFFLIIFFDRGRGGGGGISGWVQRDVGTNPRAATGGMGSITAV